MIIDRVIKKINFLKAISGLKAAGTNLIILPPYILGGKNNISIGNSVTIHSGLRMIAYEDKVKCNCDISIGNGCYFGYRLTVLAGGAISVGDNVLIGSDVSIVSYNHGIIPESNVPYKDQELIPKPISIGDNCWIGDKVVITAGTVIGKGCVIGAGSIVTKDIPDFSMAVGNPAKIIKKWDFVSHEWIKV